MKSSDQRWRVERFTCEMRSYPCTETTGAAALPRLLRHFVLLSHTHTHTVARSLARSHTSSHMRSPLLSVIIPPPLLAFLQC